MHRRGAIVSLSVEAKRAGLAAGMRLTEARAVCPAAQFVPWEEGRYEKPWREALDICARWVSTLEPTALGEAFFEPTGPAEPAALLAEMRRAVSQQTDFTCVVGGGPSKLVAKIAAELEPGRVVTADEAPGFLAPLPILRLWSLDEAARERLEALGLATIGLLQSVSESRLAEQFGDEARQLADLARGIDDSPVRPLYPPRTVAVRRSWPDGVRNAEVIETCLRKLSAEIAAGLRRRKEACGRLSMQVETEGGKATSRSIRLRLPGCQEAEILRACRRMLGRMTIGTPVVGIAVEASDFSLRTSVQLDLFARREASSAPPDRTGEAIAAAREQFGGRAVVPGAELEASRRERALAALARGES